MVKYLAGRLLATIPTLILVTMMVFTLLLLSPGDPLSLLAPLEEPLAMLILAASHGKTRI